MNQPILLFDGVCNLCNGLVTFILLHEKDSEIHFCALQSGNGQKLAKEYELANNGFNSLAVIENGKLFEKSEAIFKIVAHLKYPWKGAMIFRLVPSFFSNRIYSIVAKNRYRIFGKSDECMVPQKKWNDRFLI